MKESRLTLEQINYDALTQGIALFYYINDNRLIIKNPTGPISQRLQMPDEYFVKTNSNFQG